MRMSATILLLFLLAVAAASCGGPGTSARFSRALGTAPDIRVLLDEGKERLEISADNGFVIRTVGGVTVQERSGAGAVVVTLRNVSLNFELRPGGELAAIEGEALVVGGPNSTLSYNGVPYAGHMRVIAAPNRTLSLVNVLPLETYLEGVLPHEIGDPGPDGYDAVKGQAVAARTYAFEKITSRSTEAFDVYATVQDQVYRGLEGRTAVASAAVRDTRGRILAFSGGTVRAYYSACCGGHTSDIRLVWPLREPFPYLYGAADRDARDRAAFCQDNRYFRWRYSFTGRELGATLRVTIPRELGIAPEDVGELKDMRIEKRSDSGRVIDLLIVTTKNEFRFTGDRIRWVLMTDVERRRILPSVMFRIDKTMERDRIAFVSIVGGGNGHGVGMCQAGAIAMARRGYTYPMILSHYYRGCAVEKAY